MFLILDQRKTFYLLNYEIIANKCLMTLDKRLLFKKVITLLESYPSYGGDLMLRIYFCCPGNFKQAFITYEYPTHKPLICQ